MHNEGLFDEKMMETIQSIAGAGIDNAARGFSGMIGHRVEVCAPCVEIVPLLEIHKIVGGPEDEAIGIYLRAEGEIGGQMMLIIPYARALELVDLMLGQDAGTTTHLGKLERSALGEVGNLTGTFFLNEVARITGIEIRPTPPAVIVDMVGAILDIIIATTGGVSDQVILMKALFIAGERKLETDFWAIPDPVSLKAFHSFPR